MMQPLQHVLVALSNGELAELQIAVQALDGDQLVMLEKELAVLLALIDLRRTGLALEAPRRREVA